MAPQEDNQNIQPQPADAVVPAVTPVKKRSYKILLVAVFSLLFPPLFIALIFYAAWLGLKGRRSLALKLLVALVAASFGSLVYYGHRPQGGEIKITPNTYFVSEKTSQTSVAGLSFLKPDSFAKTTNTNSNNVETTIYAKTKKGQPIGFIAVSAAKNNLVDDKKYMDGVNSLMKSGSVAPAYAKFAEPFSSFIKSFNSPELTFNLGEPKPFTSTAIKNNAWSVDYSSNSTKHAAAMQGRFILIGQKGRFYYFVIETSSAGWNTYARVTQQVLGSLKVQ